MPGMQRGCAPVTLGSAFRQYGDGTPPCFCYERAQRPCAAILRRIQITAWRKLFVLYGERLTPYRARQRWIKEFPGQPPLDDLALESTSHEVEAENLYRVLFRAVIFYTTSPRASRLWPACVMPSANFSPTERSCSVFFSTKRMVSPCFTEIASGS